MKTWLRISLLATLALPSAALADHPFILPSSTTYAGTGNSATFDAAGSDHVFFFDHRPLQLGSIAIQKPDGTPGMPYNALQGRFRSVFDLKLDQPGTWKVASLQSMVTGTFKQNGEERRVGGRPGMQPGGAGAAGGQQADAARASNGPPGAPGGDGTPRRQPPVAYENIPADATDLHLTEVDSRVETFVTVDQPTVTVLQPTGKGIELDPVTHPNAIVAGETARFRFLIDGRPASGVKVTVIPAGDRYRDDAGAMVQTTGADGVVAIRWPAAGMYWLGAEAEDDKASQPRVEKRRLTYAATLEVMTP